ncbi:Mbov_0392 family ICE element protein [Mycoplasmopsis agalactiae]|uniref:Mbov_0392 family ICE element protein n=1 Tax=Mycoplasmopsis agalactiae TaxID=2110 RepID=UPI0032ED14EC
MYQRLNRLSKIKKGVNNEKNFNFKDIAYLTQYAPMDITDEMVENHFEYMANSYEDKLDKLAYIELVKKTTENMTYITDDINKKIYESIYQEEDLDKLAGYYKLSEDLANGEAYEEDSELWNKFWTDEDIHLRADLWEQIDNDLKTNGIEANLYLANDLLLMPKDVEWVRINVYERAESISHINKEFDNWVSDQDLENCLSSYDKEEFIYDFKLEKQLEEKLEEKDKKEKALVM